MTKVEVALGERSYAVMIEDGLIDRAGELLAPYARSDRLPVVSDDIVWAAQGPRLEAALRAAGISAVPLIVPHGEQSKNWSTLSELIDQLLALELGRTDHLLAFGGGMIGDLAGFAAAIFKRGCGYIQMPTSLLAQVDSSVGGKTGLNVSAGKNLVGAIHQPSLVLIDPALLDTLPPRHLRAGYAEIVKYGLIGDSEFFGWCKRNGAALLAGDAEARRHAIWKSVAAKAAIVEQDERETGGRRALLNLGHTFGHALEAAAGFSDRLLHGEAVAVGMVLAFSFSARCGLCPREDAEQVQAHLSEVGLPTRFDAAPAELLRHIRQDKKATGGTVPFVLARGIGEAFLDRDVDLDQVANFLARERTAE